MTQDKRVAVIGAGPAGMCAAIAASQNGYRVDLYDHNEKTGKKLFITGKGRCNVTNDRPIEDFFDQIVTNKKFLYSSLYSFTNDQLKDMIEGAGTRLKTERGGRVFPESDKSSDILKAFNRLLDQHDVNVYLGTHIRDLLLQKEGSVTKAVGIKLSTGEVRNYDAVILATGGVSYQTTGSDGSGLAIASRAGHHIVEPRAALVSIDTTQSWPGTLAGLTLKNVTLTLFEMRKGKKKKIYQNLGEMLFTHTGVSGPLVLSASSLVKKDPSDYEMEIDLKPGLTPEKLEARITRDLTAAQKKLVENAIEGLLPKRLIPVVLKIANIPATQIAGNVTKEEKQRLVQTLKHLPLDVKSLGNIRGAIITSGGVDVKEVDPATMKSKLIEGLSFAGEMLDVDAFTGGFNIQIAASTGYLAGMSLNEER